MNKKILASLIMAATTGMAFGQTVVSTDVTTDATWSGTVILQRPIFVKNGATLTIQPGTIVRGQPRTATVTPGSTVGTPGALIVTQTGSIVASGDENNPIIFTTAALDSDQDGNPDLSGSFLVPWGSAADNLKFYDSDPKNKPLAPFSADGSRANVTTWGGLVVLGNAPTNLNDPDGRGWGKGLVEGLTIPGFPPADATYGGVLPHDNSGVIRYISVRHAGDEIGEGNELNGITLGGVGDGTIFENIEVYCNFDDGIEWFGGTVNGKNLVVVFAGDDQFDLDQGYTGINQYCFAVMPFFSNFGSGSGEKGCEWDGDDANLAKSVAPNTDVKVSWRSDPAANEDKTPWPLSNPLFYNLTILGGAADDAGGVVDLASTRNSGRVNMRHGFAGGLWNSIVVNTGTDAAVKVENGSEGTTTAGNTTLDLLAAGLVVIGESSFYDSAAFSADSDAALANGDAISGTGLFGGNKKGTGAILVNEDQTFAISGTAGKLDPNVSLKDAQLDPRPAGSTFAESVTFNTPSGVEPATFRGAFDPSTTLFTTGWSVLNLGGILAD